MGHDARGGQAQRRRLPFSGRPILDADKARSIIVLKRSFGHGYTGVDNGL